MRTKKALAVLLAVGLATSLALAQQHQRPNATIMVQKHVQHLTTLLTLDSNQAAQITTILTNAMNESSTSRGDMKTAHQNLQTAIKNNDDKGIQAAATSIGNMMAQRIVARAKTDALINQVLRPDQQAKMNELKGEGMGMGFGPRGHFMH